MNILNPEFRWTPACATDIRETFRKAMQHTEADDWNSRIEGAKQVMRNLKPRPICRTINTEE